MDYNFNATLKTFLTLDKEKNDNHLVEIIADLDKEHFLAITENSLPENGKERTVNVAIKQLAQAPGGQSSISTSTFVRGADEKYAMITLFDIDGKQVAQTRSDYGIS